MSAVPSNLLQMQNISKRFGATVALQGVDLTVQAGEVHALIGENGAGKSTLMKILAGVYPPDAGTMTLAGRPYRPAGPADARRRGISMIYQERNLAPDLSVEANVMLGLESTQGGFLQRKTLRRQVVEALEILGHPDLQPETLVWRLGPGAQQLVEIARALVVAARIVVFDEPTSSLSYPDVQQLFVTIRRLRGQEVGVVYISHFLEEVREIADCYTVLRDGRTVGHGGMAEVSLDELIRLMTGRSMATLFPRIPHPIGRALLRLEGLTGERLPQAVDLTLHQGEILGLFGLVGSGRSELLRALYGLDPLRSGRVTIAAVSDRGHPPYIRQQQGLGLLSEDRQAEGLALDQSVADNMTYGRMTPFVRGGLLQRKKRARAVQAWIQRLKIRARGPDQPVGILSGGNQQKVAMARLLHWDADILLLDEPTRGIDIASKAAIYRLIGELAAQGKAILFVSAYLPELIGVCDRICVMYRGRLSVPIAAQKLDPHHAMSLATRGSERKTAQS